MQLELSASEIRLQALVPDAIAAQDPLLSHLLHEVRLLLLQSTSTIPQPQSHLPSP